MTVEILTPKSREEWLKARRKTIGASEAACLVTTHPFVSYYGLHAVKTGRIEPDADETPAMKRGRVLEETAVRFLRDERPTWKVLANPIPGGRFYRDPELGLSCTPDAFAIDPDRPGQRGVIQVKSVAPEWFRTHWHVDDELVPPAFVAVQAIQEAYLTGSSWAIVAPIVVGRGIEMPLIEVPLHAGVIEALKEGAREFWALVASGRIPDPDYKLDVDTISAIYRHASGPEIDLSADNSLVELLDERERLRTDQGAAKKRLDEIKAELLHKLDGAASARVADGRLITAKTVSRKAYQVEATSFIDVRIRNPATKEIAA